MSDGCLMLMAALVDFFLHSNLGVSSLDEQMKKSVPCSCRGDKFNYSIRFRAPYKVCLIMTSHPTYMDSEP